MSAELYGHEFQNLILRSLITDRQLFVRCQSILDKKYFDAQFKKAIEFIHDYSNEYKNLPSVDQIKVKSGLTVEKLDVYNPDYDQAFYLDEIEKFCKHKAAYHAILDCTDLMQNGNPEGIEAVVKKAALVGLTRDLGIDYFENPKERLRDLLSSVGTIKTGWDDVDKMLGNVGRQELLIFAGGSGSGKSVALANLGINLASQGLNVVYFSMELHGGLVGKRMDSMISGIAQADIFKRLDDIELKVKHASKTYGKLRLVRFPENSTTVLDFKAYLKELEIATGTKMDVVIVDYIDLMVPTNKRLALDNLFLKDKFVSEELRALAHEFDCLVASATQLNRTAVSEAVFDHSHIQGGISKIQTADNVIGIKNTEALRHMGEIQFQYLKTRNSGGVGKTSTLAYDVETLRISNLTGQQNAAASAISNSHNKLLGSLGKKQNAAEDSDVEETKQEDVMKNTQALRDLINKNKK